MTDHDPLQEVALDSETLYQGNFLCLKRDTVRLPDGAVTTREYVKHPGAVVVVPLLDDGRVLLERQFRYPVGQVMIELPAGKLDVGEDPLDCARRELLEETGYSARQWARAGVMHLAIGYSDEILHIYFARDLSAGERQLDEGEFLDVIAMPVDAFLDGCRTGLVTDAKSLSCALWLQNVQCGDWALDWQDMA